MKNFVEQKYLKLFEESTPIEKPFSQYGLKHGKNCSNCEHYVFTMSTFENGTSSTRLCEKHKLVFNSYDICDRCYCEDYQDYSSIDYEGLFNY